MGYDAVYLLNVDADYSGYSSLHHLRTHAPPVSRPFLSLKCHSHLSTGQDSTESEACPFVSRDGRVGTWFVFLKVFVVTTYESHGGSGSDRTNERGEE